MIRLLLVDDEPEILDWLYEMFTLQDRFPLDVYRAGSGSAAIALLGKVKFDVVLSDIRMPGMTGLQLMERIKGLWPGCRIIFLTGYSEFEYVYSAIQHDGVSYLLKTEEDEVIFRSVEKAIAEITEERRAAATAEQLSNAFSQAVPFLKRGYLSDCLTGTGQAVAGISLCHETMKIEIDRSSPVYLVSGRLDCFKGPCAYRQFESRIISLQWKAFETFASHFRHEMVLMETFEVIWLLQPIPDAFPKENHPETDRDAIPLSLLPMLEGMLEGIQEYVRMALDTPVSFVYSTQPWSWNDLHDGYGMLQDLLGRIAGLGPEIILNERNLSEKPMNLSDAGPVSTCLPIPCGSAVKTETPSDPLPRLKWIYYSSERTHLLLKGMPLLMERGEKDLFLHNFIEITGDLRSCKSRNDPIALEIYYSISTFLLAHINRHGVAEKLAFHVGTNALTRLDLHGNWTEAVDYLHEVSEALFVLMEDRQGRQLQASIRRICEYIATHLDEDLSLLRLSELSYFNPSYLSRLFRQETGQTLSDFIAALRCDKAKELLHDPAARIMDVTTAVGFESAHYFSRFFKKMTGLTPQEYRETCTVLGKK